MPGFDGTGPRGQGPMTGRGMGYGRSQEGDVVDPGGRGFGMGRGRGWGRGLGRRLGLGRGRGRGWGLGRVWSGEDVDAGPTDDELEGLRAESSRLKAELDVVERRLSSFEKRD